MLTQLRVIDSAFLSPDELQIAERTEELERLTAELGESEEQVTHVNIKMSD